MEAFLCGQVPGFMLWTRLFRCALLTRNGGKYPKKNAGTGREDAVKTRQFEYIRASDLTGALTALRTHEDSAVLAGGQSLMAMMNMRVAAQSHLIDISRIKDLHGTSIADGMLHLGALVRHVELESDRVIAAAAPLLRRAALELAHPAIRNRGTLGGSLSLADPAAELPACVLALDGTLEIASSEGRRHVRAQDFFLGAYDTALNRVDLLVSVKVPVAEANARFGYCKLARRHGDYAQVGLAVKAIVEGTVVASIRPVFFAVQDRPVLAHSASEILKGAAVDDDAALDRAVAALADDLSPQGQPGCSAEAKAHMAGVLLRRVLKSIATGEK